MPALRLSSLLRPLVCERPNASTEDIAYVLLFRLMQQFDGCSRNLIASNLVRSGCRKSERHSASPLGLITTAEFTSIIFIDEI